MPRFLNIEMHVHTGTWFFMYCCLALAIGEGVLISLAGFLPFSTFEPRTKTQSCAQTFKSNGI